MDAHDLVARLKSLASELGRIPKRDEYVEVASEYHYKKCFGSYTALLHAAGFKGEELAKEHKAKKIPELDSPEKIEQSISTRNSKQIYEIKGAKKIFVLGDIHFPFVDKNALSMAYALIKREKPDVVIQVGDLDDQYSNSKFPRSLNVYTPKAEDELARQMGVEMWATIKRIAPQAKCFQLMGNHNARALKRVVEKWPEGEHIVEEYMVKRMTFEGVTTVYDPTDDLIIDGVLFIHGHYSQLGAHRDFNRMNVVCGHSHRGGVSYRSYNGEVFWELNAGYLGDPHSKALSYRPQKTHNWTIGVGIIDEYGPRFVAF